MSDKFEFVRVYPRKINPYGVASPTRLWCDIRVVEDADPYRFVVLL